MIKKMVLISITGVILLFLIVSCTQSAATLQPDDAEVETLIINKCGDCHTPDRVFQADYSRDKWSDVFDSMITRGADVSPDEKTLMIDWLVTRDQ